MAEFYDKYYYKNANGEMRLLSVFHYQRPLNNVQQLYGLDPVVNTVDSPFTEIDMNSPWINDQF
ncbi:MAG: hypothetical protein VZQ98_11525 [Bacteroidales bacterium]|nr:hypothetical protein [Bacteroidales bacterium]